ncbi:hypothetical protein NDU88_005775 [Pleurodeles waltl]|uniref:Uncharacterized protein n=1 Tax=Pleurodeles waltl TaxID=8319 RepID=A0AAV7LQ15_PLEWA|nr:hypothetical protein NDU88_005775 [Pleurodeles waltl]
MPAEVSTGLISVPKTPQVSETMVEVPRPQQAFILKGEDRGLEEERRDPMDQSQKPEELRVAACSSLSIICMKSKDDLVLFAAKPALAESHPRDMAIVFGYVHM